MSDPEAKEIGKENPGEKGSENGGSKEKQKDEATPSKPMTTGVANNAADAGGDLPITTPTPRGKGGKNGNEGMISPESLEAA